MLMATAPLAGCRGGNHRRVRRDRGVGRGRGIDSSVHLGEYAGCLGSIGDNRTDSALVHRLCLLNSRDQQDAP